MLLAYENGMYYNLQDNTQTTDRILQWKHVFYIIIIIKISISYSSVSYITTNAIVWVYVIIQYLSYLAM